MKNPVFRFKEFEVDQTGCAMKINTDGVLLGAMTEGDRPGHILDIGTGTGVIALMLAQRFPVAAIDAVEIDPVAAATARKNFKKSPFSGRLQIAAGSFEDLEREYLYDIIVSNPPFYTNSLHNPDARKKTAKHSDLRFFEALLAFAHKKLQTAGTLQLILPTKLATGITALAQEYDLHRTHTIAIRSFEDSEIFRQIISLRRGTSYTVSERDFVIYAGKGVYSGQYKNLLRPFFLDF